MTKYNFNNIIRSSAILLLIRVIILQIISAIILFTILYFSGYSGIQNLDTTEGVNLNQLLSKYLGKDIYWWFILFIIQLLVTLWLFFNWYNRVYVLEQNKIIFRWGTLIKNSETYDIKSIELIKYKQSIAGRIFNFGTIIIKDIFIKEILKIPQVDNPKDVINKIQSLCSDENVTFLGLIDKKITQN